MYEKFIIFDVRLNLKRNCKRFLKHRYFYDEDYDEITEDQETSVKEKLKSKWSRLEAVAGAKSRVQKMEKDSVHHYEERRKAMLGKSMVVVMSRRIAIDLYKEIVKLRSGWHSDDDDRCLHSWRLNYKKMESL